MADFMRLDQFKAVGIDQFLMQRIEQKLRDDHYLVSIITELFSYCTVASIITSQDQRLLKFGKNVILQCIIILYFIVFHNYRKC